MPEISVIFPMYNVEKYVRNSLMSVLNQTFTDFELIAVNDGSTDATAEVFCKVIEESGKDIPVRLIDKKNGGLADARNAALDQAQGEYVVFVDSDDLVHPRYLETLITDARRFQTDLSASSFKYVTAETLHDYDPAVPGTAIERSELMRLLLLRKKFITGCWALLIRRKLIEDNHLRFNTEVRFSVDQAFIWQVTDLAERISINHSKLYHYYLRSGSIMTATKKADLLSGVRHFTGVVGTLEHLPFHREILLNRWKLGILHSSAILSEYADYKDVKDQLGMKYSWCLRVPDYRIKALAVLGMLSDKALYRVFRRHNVMEGITN